MKKFFLMIALVASFAACTPKSSETTTVTDTVSVSVDTLATDTVADTTVIVK